MNLPVILPIDSRKTLRRYPAAQRGSPPLDLVKKQASRILQSSGFANAPRMKRFLAFIVEETLAGRAGQLCEYTLGVSVFDRDESFDPASDPIVRNDARRLRQKLLEYYQMPHGARDWVYIDVPKGSYVPVFTVWQDAIQPPQSRYRLTISLVRATDGVEVFVREYPFDDTTMQLEVTCAGAS